MAQEARVYILAKAVGTSNETVTVHGVTLSAKEYSTWLAAGGVGLAMNASDEATKDPWTFESVE
jgi:hypothetical protein